MLKKTYLTITMAAVLTACGHRTSTDSTSADTVTAVTDSVVPEKTPQLTVDSIGLVRQDSMAIVEIRVDWPVNGNEALVQSIRKYLCEELADDPVSESRPKPQVTDDGKEAVKTTVKRLYNELSGMWKEAHDEGYATDMVFSRYQHVFLLEDTEKYVTYQSNSEGFTGGAHGYATADNATFRKSDGLRIGYRTEYNSATEKFEIKGQTLFKDTKSPAIHQLIKENLRLVLADTENSGMPNDEQLTDMLQVDDINRIPLPSAPPCFTRQGLCFTYQQYEIACYAMGIISFYVPYDKIRPYLTADAAELLP
jgi:hypothetical protein